MPAKPLKVSPPVPIAIGDTIDDARELIWAILVLAAETDDCAHIHAVANAAREKLERIKLLLNGRCRERAREG